jgi:hypothetical protein
MSIAEQKVYKIMEKWCSKTTYTIMLFAIVLIGIAWSSVAGWKMGNHLTDTHFYAVVNFSAFAIGVTLISFLIDNVIRLFKYLRFVFLNLPWIAAISAFKRILAERDVLLLENSKLLQSMDKYTNENYNLHLKLKTLEVDNIDCGNEINELKNTIAKQELEINDLKNNLNEIQNPKPMTLGDIGKKSNFGKQKMNS